MRQQTLPLLLVAALMFAGCSVKEPGSPSWQVELTVPIADRVYPLEEILVDSSELDSLGNWVSNQGGIPIFNFADSIEPVFVDNNFSYDALSEVVENYLGTRTVSPPAPDTAFYPIIEVLPQVTPGQNTIVPPFTFSQPPDVMEPFEEYEWAVLEWGDITLTVQNNFPVPLVNLTILVRAIAPVETVLSVFIPDTLAPGESSVHTAPMPTGKILDNVMSVEISGESPGSPELVYIPYDADIQVVIQLSELGVTAALAHLLEQTFFEDSTYSIPETDTVITASIKQGNVSYQIENQSDLINTITFTLPDFTSEGLPYEDQVTLPPHQTYSVSNQDLSGYTFARPQRDNQVRALVNSVILDTGDPQYGNPSGLIEFNSNDLVITHYQISELFFSYFEGVLDTVSLDINQEPEALEGVPEGLESLDVEEAIAGLHLVNTIGLPVTLDLKMDAYKNGVMAYTFNVPQISIPAAQGATPGTLDQDIEGLESLVNLLPDSVRTYGMATVLGEVSVAETDFLQGYFHISSPFYFTIDSTWLEPVASTLDQGLDDDLAQVQLSVTLENHLPLTGEALILASFDSSEFNIQSSSAVDTLFQAPLPAAQLGSDGFVSASGFATITESLDPQEMILFENASSDHPLYMQTKILINSTNGDTVRCRITDYITVGASAQMILDINTGDDN